jgi:hypothetical protein
MDISLVINWEIMRRLSSLDFSKAFEMFSLLAMFLWVALPERVRISDAESVVFSRSHYSLGDKSSHSQVRRFRVICLIILSWFGSIFLVESPFLKRFMRWNIRHSSFAHAREIMSRIEIGFRSRCDSRAAKAYLDPGYMWITRMNPLSVSTSSCQGCWAWLDDDCLCQLNSSSENVIWDSFQRGDEFCWRFPPPFWDIIQVDT